MSRGRKLTSPLSLVARAGGSQVAFEMLDSKMSTPSRTDSSKIGFIGKPNSAFRIQTDLLDGSRGSAERGKPFPNPRQVVFQGLLPWCLVTVPLAIGIEVDNVAHRPDIVHVSLDILCDHEAA